MGGINANGEPRTNRLLAIKWPGHWEILGDELYNTLTDQQWQQLTDDELDALILMQRNATASGPPPSMRGAPV